MTSEKISDEKMKPGANQADMTSDGTETNLDQQALKSKYHLHTQVEVFRFGKTNKHSKTEELLK